jgi:hypothetical protein
MHASPARTKGASGSSPWIRRKSASDAANAAPFGASTSRHRLPSQGTTVPKTTKGRASGGWTSAAAVRASSVVASGSSAQRDARVTHRSPSSQGRSCVRVEHRWAATEEERTSWVSVKIQTSASIAVTASRSRARRVRSRAVGRATFQVAMRIISGRPGCTRAFQRARAGRRLEDPHPAADAHDAGSDLANRLMMALAFARAAQLGHPVRDRDDRDERGTEEHERQVEHATEHGDPASDDQHQRERSRARDEDPRRERRVAVRIEHRGTATHAVVRRETGVPALRAGIRWCVAHLLQDARALVGRHASTR